ncbi:GlxA family transcriptional regulator [Vibrio rotiferianus]|uniref:GlxA family transcriptional regulator n=1 Tax=Vibrio rotiferianus TaxID=190895 RepID=UPI0005EFAEC6|nr:helix-turn-helix domain-containing protein [Vibrio rotiferianus]
MEQTTITLTALAFPGGPATSITGPIEVLTTAAYLAGVTPPEINIVTQDNNPVVAHGGITLTPTAKIESIKSTDILLIGSLGEPDSELTACSKKALKWLEDFADTDIPIISISTGSFALAKANLLSKRNATTHWRYANLFRDMYPDTKLRVERKVTCDGNYYCTSCTNGYNDVMMLVVEQLFGLSVRDRCQQHIFGNTDKVQQQSLAKFLPYRQHSDALIHQLQDWMHNHHSLQFSVFELSERIHLSERQMKRRFKLATGQTPIQYIQQIRLSAAKDKLETTKQTVEEISRVVGYEDVRYFRELFKKFVDMTPLEYRKRYQH